MEHIKLLRDNGLCLTGGAAKTLIERASGCFYTHELIGRDLIAAILRNFIFPVDKLVKVIDPFCGDGRLICWLLESASLKAPECLRWQIELWDYDETAVVKAQSQVRQVACRLGLNADCT